jgi:hypothetical protein
VIPAFWSAPLPTYLWQVALHSWVMGLIFYVWVHRVDLPSGQTKRLLLVLLLTLPMATAAIPGRSAVEFGERVAWLNSARILAVPVLGDFHVAHLVLLIAAMMTALTLWQEVLPLRGRPRAVATDVPDTLRALVRAREGWAQCRVRLSSADAIVLATGGLPGRPTLIVSQGALAQLTPPELEVAVAHEHAHWQGGRWLWSRVLFVARLLQCFNPVALWAFREYCIEDEIRCDAVAVTGRDPHLLARVLLKIYQSTDRHDVAALGALRKRVDVLLAGGPQDAALPGLTIVAAAIFMLVVLPWLV